MSIKNKTAELEEQDYFSDDGFIAFFTDVAGGKFPKFTEALLKRFPEESDISGDDIQKGLKFYYNNSDKDVPTPRDFEFFNKANNSNITPQLYSRLKNFAGPMHKYWEEKLKGKYNKYTKPLSFGNKKVVPKGKVENIKDVSKNTLNIKEEFGKTFLGVSQIPVTEEEQNIGDALFEDQVGNILNIGDIFYIPQVQAAEVDALIKIALLSDFFKSNKPEPENASDRGTKVWEPYGFPEQGKDVSSKPDVQKDLSIKYPSPEQPEKDLTREQREDLARKNKKDLYLKNNTFKVIKKFLRADPFTYKGENVSTVPWVEGVFVIDPSRVERFPVYIVSKVRSYSEKTSSEEFNEEVFINEIIYESLLDIIKEANDDPNDPKNKPSQAVLGGESVKAIDPATKEEFEVKKEQNSIKVTPESKKGDPSSEEFYDINSPETAKLDTTLKVIH